MALSTTAAQRPGAGPSWRNTAHAAMSRAPPVRATETLSMPIAGPNKRMVGAIMTGEEVGSRPAFLAGVLLVVVAVQIVSLGLLAELSVHLRRRRDLDAAVTTTRGRRREIRPRFPDPRDRAR